MSSQDGIETRRALEEALSGRGGQGIEVVRGARPSLLDAQAARALSAPFLAAFMIAAAVLRMQIVTTSLDLLTLLLRTAAFAFCLRALILLVRFAGQLSKDLKASEHSLAFSREGLLWRSPQGERFVARDQVLSLSVPEARASRFLPDSHLPLLLIKRPGPEGFHWSIPAYFAASSEILAARLSRVWELDTKVQEASPPPPPTQAPQARYMRAVEGKAPASEAVIPEGHGYRLRGPYGVLLGIVFALDALLTASSHRALLLQPVLLSCLLALTLPGIWLFVMSRRAAVRLGIAMLLTPEELIVRGKQGVVSVPWNQLGEVSLTLRELWSPFVGGYTVKTLHMTTHEGTFMSFDGGFLGVPPEVVLELCSAYRKGRVADATQLAS